jgi:L,D-peptidoglycan transpeptidase YkuD (ErfK/YbiS/YcfS/YnhG family)
MARSNTWSLLAFALVLLGAQTSGAWPSDCPETIGKATRLILVTTPTMDGFSARMRLFVRNSPDAPWLSQGRAEQAVVGKAGLAWGYPFIRFKREGELEKFEGDKRTPAGFFSIGPSFGFARSGFPGEILVKAGETVCVEDPTSPLYNTIATRAELGPGVLADDMRSSPHYRVGLFVNYPTHRGSRRGSCIFIHIWSAPTKGTAGCIALSEEHVRMLQYFSVNGALLVVLPVPALKQFSECLPEVLN